MTTANAQETRPLAQVARLASVEYQRLWRALSGSELTPDEHERLRRAGYVLDQNEQGARLHRVDESDG